MKRYLIFLSIFIYGFFLIISDVNAECKYKAEIDKCLGVIDSGQGDRTITDFTCVDYGDRERTIYQIIYDLKMKEIDKEIEKFLVSLQDYPTYYFGISKIESYIDGINYINTNFAKHGDLWNRYREFCSPTEENSVVKEYFECTENEDTKNNVYSYFLEGTSCTRIIELKLDVSKKVSYDLLQIGKYSTLKDYRTKQIANIRDKYDDLVQDMYTNLDYIMRINNQRDKVTKKCQTISKDG